MKWILRRRLTALCLLVGIFAGAQGCDGKSAPTAPPGTRRAHAFVSGRVQGVSFRWFTTRNAQELGLTGWVMNLDDGRVEAVIEGPADKVAELLKRIEQGPPMAEVEKVEVTDETPTGEFESFAQQ